jgi:hypothetical protein
VRLFAGLTAASLACLALPADTKPIRSSLYSSVRYVEEAGDDLGMEIRIHVGEKPWIDFIDCEGQCLPQVRLPITLTPKGFTFVYRESVIDQDGKPAPDMVMPFVAIYEGANLVVRMKGAPSEKLRPIRKAIALQ